MSVVLLLVVLSIILFSDAAPCPATPACKSSGNIVPGICTAIKDLVNNPTDIYNLGAFATPGSCSAVANQDQMAISAVIVKLQQFFKTASGCDPLNPTTPCTNQINNPCKTAAAWSALFEHFCLGVTAQCIVNPVNASCAPVKMFACQNDCTTLFGSAVSPGLCNQTKLFNLVNSINPAVAQTVNAVTNPAICPTLGAVPSVSCRANTKLIAPPQPSPSPIAVSTVPAVCPVPVNKFALSSRFGAVCNDYLVQVQLGANIGPALPRSNVVQDAATQEALFGVAANIDDFFFENANSQCPILPQYSPTIPKNFTGNEPARRAYMALLCSAAITSLTPNNVSLLPCRSVCEKAVSQCGGFDNFVKSQLNPLSSAQFALTNLFQQCDVLPREGNPAVPCNLSPFFEQLPPSPRPKEFLVTNLVVAPIPNSYWYVNAQASFLIKGGDSLSKFQVPQPTQIQFTYTIQVDSAAPVSYQGQSMGYSTDYRIAAISQRIGGRDWGQKIRFCITSLSYAGFRDDVSPMCANYEHLNVNAPNFILIIADDMGNGDIEYCAPGTTNLQRMKTEGMTHTQMLMGESTCTPSRAAMMTGRYPIRYDMASNERRVVQTTSTPGGISANEYLLGDMLKEHGYVNGYFGKWHLGLNEKYNGDFLHLPTNFGYDVFYGIPLTNNEICDPTYPDQYASGVDCILMEGTAADGDMRVIEQPFIVDTLAKRITDRAIDFIRSYASPWWNLQSPMSWFFSDWQRTPFHAVVAFATPHITLGHTSEFTGVTANKYCDTLAELDYSVGRILDTLKELDIDKQTYVLFVSDNGPAVEAKLEGGVTGGLKGGKGQSSWEGGFRVPGISWWPNTIPAASTSAESFAGVDILPTIASLIGVSPNPQQKPLDGRDYSSILKNPAVDLADRFVPHYCGKIIQSARYGDYKVHFATTIWGDPVIQGCPGPLLHAVCSCTTATIQPQPNLLTNDFSSWPPVYNVVTDPTESNPLPNTTVLPGNLPITNWYIGMSLKLKEHITSVGVVPAGNILLGNYNPYLVPICPTWDPLVPGSCVEQTYGPPGHGHGHGHHDNDDDDDDDDDDDEDYDYEGDDDDDDDDDDDN